MSVSSPIPLKELPKFLQSRFKKRVAYGTCFRWVRRGISGVKLRSVYFAGAHYVTSEAVDEFLAQVTAAKAGEQPKPTSAEKAAYRRRQKARAVSLGIDKQ